MLKIVASRKFKKALRLAVKRNLDLCQLREAVNTLAAEMPLDRQYHDHELTGSYAGFRECHIHPDWLLVYRIEKMELELFLLRTGTHSALF